MSETSDSSDSSDQDRISLYPSLGLLISNLAIAITLIPLGVFVFSLLGRYFFFAELIGNFRCQILILLMPFCVLALGLRRWWLSGIVALAMLWSMVGIVWVYLPGCQPPAGKQHLKIISHNVLASNTQYADVVQQLRDVDADVMTILEYANRWHPTLDCFNDTYPYQVRLPRWHGFGIAIFSKYPLHDTHVVYLTKDEIDNPCIMTHIKMGDQTVRLAAVHVLSPTNRHRLQIRNRQFKELANELAKEDTPTVVMGDFNCTPWSPFLSDFLATTGYRDSRQGFGYQPTWDTERWPLQIPIDHAFVSDQIHVHQRWVGEAAGSDHYPIIFEISTAGSASPVSTETSRR